MPDRIETKSIDLVGGLITTMGALEQATQAPGSAIRLVNFEPTLEGGYRRIDGYAKYSTTAVTGSGNILGVALFNNGVLACRGSDIYFGTGTTWTKINGATSHTGAGIYRFTRYNFTGTEKIAFCDGANLPASYDGTSYSQLSNAPTGTQFITAFARRLWCAKGNLLTFSAVTDDNDFTPASGAGEINVGDTITGMKPWRDQLIVFCQNRILRITGDSSSNFNVQPIAESLGCVYSDTIAEVAGDIVFWGPDGLRTLSGTARIGDFNLSSISRVVTKSVRDLASDFTRLVGLPVRNLGQFRIYGYHSAIPAAVSRGLLGTLRTGDLTVVNPQQGNGWEWAELMGVQVYVADSLYEDDGTETIIFGNSTGYIYALNSGNSFDGSNIPAVFQTPNLVFDDPNIRKVFRKLRVYLLANGSYAFNVALKLDHELPDVLQPEPDPVSRDIGGAAEYDNPDAIYGVSVYGGSQSPYSEVSLVGAGFSGSFSFYTEDISPPYTITSLTIEVTHEGRK